MNQIDKLIKAAQAVVDRWDSPAWGGSAEKLRHTGEYIADLRSAIEQLHAENEALRSSSSNVAKPLSGEDAMEATIIAAGIFSECNKSYREYNENQPQQWAGLTSDERRDAIRPCFEWEGQVDEAMLMHIDEYLAIEAKLREKNGGIK